LSTTLTTGAGTEQFVLNIVKNAPRDRFDISIVQTDLQDRARLDPRYVSTALGSAQIYTIKSYRHRFSVLDNASNYASLALKQIVTYLLNAIYRVVNRSTLNKFRDSDLIYLIRNEDLSYLNPDKTRTIVLGSTHCSSLTLSPKRRGLLRPRKLLRVLRYRRIDGFHFTSARWQKDAIVHKRYDFLLPLGTDAQLFHPRRERRIQGRIKFLFVSRLETDKGIVRLLEAWKIARLRNAELHIAGTGSMTRLVQESADNRQVFYHGVLSNEDLATLYRQCDVFVFPTEGEIYGLVVLEALASGLFVIASDDLRGNFDDFEEMGTLEYVRNEPREISERMVRIAENPSKLMLGAETHQYIDAHYNWQSVSTTLFSMFERILATEPRN
jgi:glycosyltransferase involved in cell wall biosynthesis